jgi:nucleoside-diphosphate-sugar epimerase
LRGHERVAVTGATGWLGASALDLLDEALGANEAARRVTAYASRARLSRTLSGRDVDVRPLEELPYQAPSPTHVLHFAYLTRDRLADLSVPDYIAANLGITATVIDAVARHRPEGLVMASSGAVYGRDGRLATDIPANAYGTLKHLDELAFRTAARDIGCTAVIPRIFSVAGARMTKPDLYALGSLIGMARASGPLTVTAAGPVIRTFAGATEIVGLSLWAALTRREAVFDTGGDVIEIGELAGLVAELHGLGPDAVQCDLADGTPEHRYTGDATEWNRLLTEAKVAPTPLRTLIGETSAWLGRPQADR